MKHKFRKPLSLILSLAIIISMGFPAYATEGDSVPNPSGETITEPETPPESPADPEPGDSSGGPDLPENPDGMNPEETEKLPSAEETPEIPADPAGDETSEPPADNPAGDESPEETPTETPPSGSGEDSPSTDNGENTPPSGTTEAGSPADPPAGDGQAAEQPSAKAPAADSTGTDGLCTHHTEHTADCGYAAADETNEEKPCTYDCKFCPIEEKISALPESVTAENKETVQTQVDEIAALLAALAEGESANVFNLSAYEDIKQQLETPEPYAGTAAARVEKEGQEAIEVDTLEEAFTAENSGAMVTLLKDVVVEKPIPIPSGSFTLDLGGHNINYENTNGLTLFSIQGQSALMVQGSGTITTQTITTQLGTIIQVLNGGTLILNGGTFSGTSTLGSILIATNGTAEINEGVSFNYGSDVAVNVNGGTATINGGTIGRVVYNQGTLNLYGGTFSNISSNSQSLKDLLSVKDDSTCYAYYLDGELIKDPNILAGKELTGDITVKECTHEEMQITPNEDGTTHNKTCPSCNLPPVENEPCTFQPTPGKEPTSTEHFGSCSVCGRAQDGEHTGEWSPDGKRTCTVCGLEQEAVAKCKDLMHSTTTFITDLQEITKPGVYYEVTLIKGVELTAPIIFPEEEGANIQLDLAGHTIRAGDFSAFQVNTGSNFVINKSETGQIINNSPNNATIEINNGSFTFFGGNVTNTSGLALNLKYEYVHSARYGSSILIYGGRFSGGIRWLCTGGSYLKEFAPDVAFYDENDNLITEHILDAAGTLTGVITVKECTHKGQLTDNGDGTHGGKCPVCNTVLTPEPHVWDTTGDIPVCTDCRVQAIAEEKNETSGETKYIAEFQEEYATSTNISIKLLQDVDLGEKQIFLNGNQSGEYKFALDLNGHTLASNHSSEAVYVSGFEFTLKDSSEGKTGKIEGGKIGINIRGSAAILNMEGGTVSGSSNDAAIKVQVNPTVNISGGIVDSKGYAGLYLSDSASGTKVQITGGTFRGANCIYCREVSGVTLADMLPEGYAFYQNGKPIALDKNNTYFFAEITGDITVQVCSHKGAVPVNHDDGTHGGTCKACNTGIPVAAHTWTEEAPVCSVCGAQAIAAVQTGGSTPEYVTRLKEEYTAGGTTITLLRDVDLADKGIAINGSEDSSFILDLNGHTLSAANIAVTVTNGVLTLRDSKGGGTLESRGYQSFLVNTGGQAEISGGTFNQEVRVLGSAIVNISGGTFDSFFIDKNYASVLCNVQLTGGTFNKIVISSGSVKDLLPEGYAYYFTDGNYFTDLTDWMIEGKTFTVQKCDHTAGKKYEGENYGTHGTHKVSCAACGKDMGTDKCSFSYYSPAQINHIGVNCKFCGCYSILPHKWEEKERTNDLTTEYYKQCTLCEYEAEPFGRITMSKREITLTYGKTYTLSITAEFDGFTPAYQWKLDGEEIPGADQDAYTTPASLGAGKHTYTVTVKTAEEQEYSFDFTVQVKPAYIVRSMLEVSATKATYNGLDQKPTVTMTGLTEGADYTVSWDSEDFTNVGYHEFTVNGMGNYTGELRSDPFIIQPAEPVISWESLSQTLTYTGSAAEVEPKVTLVNNEIFDGTIAYSYQAQGAAGFVPGLPVNAGTYIIKAGIPAKGNYTAAESGEMTLTIEKSQPTITFKDRYKPDKTYDGTAIPNPVAGDLEITGAAFTDVKFTWSQTPTNAGAYTLTASIAETANTKKAEALLKVTISPKTVSNPVIELSPETFEYDGTEKKPAVTVKDGETVISSAEYTVEYSDNINAGTAKVTLTDKAGGNYAISGTGSFEITKAALESIALDKTSFTYDGTAKTPAATVKKGDSVVDPKEYEISYSNTNGGEGNRTDAGTVTVTAAAKADGNYTGSCGAKFVIHPKTLTVSGIKALNRAYDGTNRVEIVSISLSGKVEGDTVAVKTADLFGTLSGSDAGVYHAVALPALELTGVKAGNYTLTQPTAAIKTSVTIEKAPALAPKPSDLAVANEREHIYTYGVGGLLPDVPEGMSLGSSAVVYILDKVDLGEYYSGSGAKIDGQILTLPIQQVESEEEKGIGTVSVIIRTGNFKDMTATILVRSVNKIIPEGTPKASPEFITYGQAVNAVKLSGVMRDTENNKDVPGTFAWSSPENRPTVQEKYAAAWVFTPEDNGAYAIVTGTVFIEVKPASIEKAVIELNQNAFRYDGEAHSPVIVSVKLGDTILTEGVDYTAVIPFESEPGEYTVTITGTGNYTGTAEKGFRINPVEQKPVEGNTELRLEVETGLSTVPEALKKNPELDTLEKIETALRTKVEEILNNVKEQIAVFDITLQYRDSEGNWHKVEPDKFPKEGVTTILPYPAGTGPTGFKFTVQHMISSGENAGEMEDISYTLTKDGLQCTFMSLSPVAIGYEEIRKDPDPTPAPPSTTVVESDSDDDTEEAPDLEYEFWQRVRGKIEAAKPGTTVKANAHGYDRMPRYVMEALRKSGDVTLVIRWDGGEDIVIPSAEALNEARRIYYPLAYLAGYGFNASTPEEKTVDFSKLNPATGGIWEEDDPADVEAAFTAAGEREITDPQRGLAETPELAEKGIEKAIPGVYEPEGSTPEIQQTAEAQQTQAEPIQDNRNGTGWIWAALILLAAACGGVWWRKRKKL